MASDRPVDTNCGGCLGLGAHRRWCPAEVGWQASNYGRWSEICENIADSVGANDVKISNTLYNVSLMLREHALSYKSSFLQLREGEQDEAASSG